jgi:hypothetical protein
MQALRQIWNDPQHLHLAVTPRDAWITTAVIQFACRNPQLSPSQREIAERVGRALQGALAAISPVGAEYLEMGWDPTFDQLGSER